MSSTRRDFLATAITAAGAAVTPGLAHAQEHDHGHDHQVVPSDPALRVKALESLLVEKGIVDRAALDAIVDAYENKIGPRGFEPPTSGSGDQRELLDLSANLNPIIGARQTHRIGDAQESTVVFVQPHYSL